MIEHHSGSLEATPEALERIHAMLEAFWAEVERETGIETDPSWRAEFDTAVAEIAGNVMRHAYHGDGGPMELRLSLRGDKVAGRFSDQGEAFTGARAEAEIDFDAIDDLPEGGFGLALARAGLDHLGYRRTSRGVNCWLLIKRRGERP
jgi:serine/threonine-protein kinase RsbW